MPPLPPSPADPADIPHTATCHGCPECGQSTLSMLLSHARAAAVRIPAAARRVVTDVSAQVRLTSHEHLERGRAALRRLDDLVMSARAVRHRVVMA